MSDGGTHFKNTEVDSFCTENGVQHITTAAYAPWCNGLIESMNKLLLGCLHHLCAPDMDEYIESDTPINPESIPHSWPKHLDTAIRQLNDRIRPTIRRSPRELLFSLAFTPEHTLPDSPEETSASLVDINLILTDMLRMNAHLLQLETADRQKTSWDNRTPATTFEVGDLVQYVNMQPDHNHKSINKLLPRWSLPHIITGKSLNSYSLSTLSGTAIPSIFHSRRLRIYIPLQGTNLAASHTYKTTIYHDNPLQTDLDDAEEWMEPEWSNLHTLKKELLDHSTK